MFPSLNLFQTLSCPERDQCKRAQCIFSHRKDLPQPALLGIPIHDLSKTNRAIPSSKSSTVPAKRAISSSPIRPSTALPTSTGEPPRKLQKVGDPRSAAVVTSSSSSHSNNGVPILRISPAQSQVAIPVRQAMLKTLHDHFVILYRDIISKSPTIASDHALKQEDEIYKKSSKLTYRNAMIQCAAVLKRRPLPDSLSHASVGTEADLAARLESRRAIDGLYLTKEHLEKHILSKEDMIKWGYLVEIPEGPGGNEPSLEGKVTKCERCAQQFRVKRGEDADQCIYHWGRLYTTRVNGEKMRVYSCCSRSKENGEGCTHGPHVFYESKGEDLHARYPFSFLESRTATSSALDVAAVDCEMIYTTGGSRLARVSIVDGSGVEVFDQLVRMDAGVEVIDYITRFSGITPEIYGQATLTLASIRKSLNAFIDKDTILIGHALENDLKALRIVHDKCIDTAILFPHRMGAPYRRSLRDLVRENMGTLIQTDSSVGHSSLEDAAATLDLVRWYTLNKRPP